MHPPGFLRRLRAFTLIELIVVVLILGVLASLAVVGYSVVTDRAQRAAAQSDLRQFTGAALAAHAATGGELERDSFVEALTESGITVIEGPVAAAEWLLRGSNEAASAAGEFSLGFDDGQGQPVGDDEGSRAAVVTYGGGTSFWQILDASGSAGKVGSAAGQLSAADILSAETPGGEPGAGGPGEEPTGDPEPAPTSPDALGAITVARVSATEADLTWDAVKGADSYEVTDVLQNTTTTVTSPATRVTATAAPAATFSVRAINAQGAGVATVVDVAAQGAFTTSVKLASSSSEQMQFGSASAIAGDSLAIGAPRDVVDGVRSGAVYVYQRVSGVWTEKVRVVPADPQEDGMFGADVDFDASAATLAIGAPGADGTGAVYVTTRAGRVVFTQTTKLPASTTPLTSGARLGTSVAVDTGYIVAGAPRHRGAAGNAESGAAVTYTGLANAWSTMATFVGSGSGNEFGADVDISGSQLAIGAPGQRAVARYTLSNGSWQMYPYLTENTVVGDRFGASLALQGTTLVVGAPGRDTKGVDAGAMYVYTLNGMPTTLTATLTASPSRENAGFGTRVAFDGSTIVAAPSTSLNEWVYAFTKSGTTWAQESWLVNPGRDINTGFGAGVAVSGNDVVVGAVFQTGAGPRTGAAYVLTR